MSDLKLNCQNLNDVIDKLATLITNKMGKATKSGDDVFIQKICNVFCYIVFESFCFHPFHNVVHCYYNVLIVGISCHSFDLPIKLNSHFMNGSNDNIGHKGPLPMMFKSSSRWHTSQVWHILVVCFYSSSCKTLFCKVQVMP